MMKDKDAESINKYDLLVGCDPGFCTGESCLTIADL